MTHSERLESLGLTLPPVATPVGSYVPAIRFDRTILTSGQLPMRDGRLTCTGHVGRDVTIADAAQGAHVAALNALAAAADAAGGIDQIERIIRVCVYVASAPGFTDQPRVANGASDLLGEIFADAGRHVRSAVGVNELPLGAALELELIVGVRD